jgi:hypothetical protein
MKNYFFILIQLRSIAPKYQQYNSHQFTQLINEQFINRRNKIIFLSLLNKNRKIDYHVRK